VEDNMGDIFEIGGRKLNSRLFIGTGKFQDKAIISDVINAANADVVTVALRRVDMDSEDDNVLDFIPDNRLLMPNTSGARNSEEAVRIAKLARAAGCGEWIKIEVINDNRYLLPDNLETLKTVEILAKEGFTVLPYMSTDIAIAKRMVEAGAVAIMPLGSPIGSNRGFKTKELVSIMVKELDVPVIVDAGIGKPSDAAECMEIGCDAVLVNTAIAVARNPIDMAKAFCYAVEAGRLAYLSSLAPRKECASASSPLTGFLRNDE
jgi:thiazole synthase